MIGFVHHPNQTFYVFYLLPTVECLISAMLYTTLSEYFCNSVIESSIESSVRTKGPEKVQPCSDRHDGLNWSSPADW